MRALKFILIIALLSGCWRAEPQVPTWNPFSGMSNWSDGLDALFLWSNAVSILIIAACVAILVWVQIPSIRMWAWMGLTFAGTLIGCAITFSVVKPFIPFIVLGLLALMVALGIWYLIANFDALRQFVHKDKPDLTVRAQKLVEVCEALPPKPV